MTVDMRFASLLRSIVIVSLALTSNSSGELPKPICPVVYAGSMGGYELYWFYPDMHNEALGNPTDEPAHCSCPSMQDRRYSVLTRFKVNPPVLIAGVSTFIYGHDIFPNLPGDQFTPILISVKRRTPPNCFNDLWVAPISLDSGAPAGGSIVTQNVEVCLTNGYEVWAGLEWLPEFPTAPLIGINTDSHVLEQYLCRMVDSNFLLIESQEEYIIGLDVLRWTDHESKRNMSDVSGYIYFEIHYATDTNHFFSSSVRLDSLGSDSLCSRFEISDDGFICIVASDGTLSAASEYIFLERDRLPQVSISPSIMRGTFDSGNSNSYAFQMKNNGVESFYAKFGYDSSFVSLPADSVFVTPGGHIDLNLQLNGEQLSDSIVNTVVTIETSDAGYPLLYHAVFRKAEPTFIQEDSPSLPDDFNVSQPYPNPFNCSVSFDIDGNSGRQVQLEVFDILGRRVHSEALFAKSVSITHWSGIDMSGGEFSSGVYFFMFSADDRVIIRLGILLK